MTGVFRTSRKRVTVVEEQIVYTFNELIADIGGGMGLILGLSVIKLVELLFVATTRAKRAITKKLRIAAKKLKAIFAILAWGKKWLTGFLKIFLHFRLLFDKKFSYFLGENRNHYEKTTNSPLKVNPALNHDSKTGFEIGICRNFDPIQIVAENLLKKFV